jgi:hypothetical protein
MERGLGESLERDRGKSKELQWNMLKATATLGCVPEQLVVSSDYELIQTGSH